MLQSKHRELSYVRNEIGKKLHTTINNGKPGDKKPTNAGTIPIRRKGNEFELCVVTSRRCKSRFFFQKVKFLKTKN